jgi:hypothetical protein
MNCGTFHRTLEDYLEGGLDFSGRFGMERHARQCLSCGKEMSDAQRLHQMVSELQRVKAPSDFETSVLREIGIRRARGRLSGLRSFWMHRFEWPSFRKLALASSCLMILCFGIFYASRRTVLNQASTSPQIAGVRADVAVEAKEAKNNPGTNFETRVRNKPAVAEPLKLAKSAKRIRPPALVKREPVLDAEIQDMHEMQDMQDMDYVEYSMPGPDNRPVPVRLPLPKTIPMRYGQMSEEYFIQNVSH